MKVKTNTGTVELTAEMVVRGMVLRGHDGEVVTLLEGGAGLWSVKEWARGGLTPPLAPCWVECLGCDPTIAPRADCERYGVHGDAAVHGFARLRDGGAVDLRRIVIDGVVIERHGGRRVVSRVLLDDERFVGLDACRARDVDVRCLCCGEEDPSNFVPGQTYCTLAIGEHEDLATGVKWSAGGARQKPQGMAARAIPMGGKCGGGFAGCRVPATVPATYRRKRDGYIQRTHDCPEHAGQCNDQWEFLGREAPRDIPTTKTHFTQSEPAVIWQMGTATLGQSQAHVLRDGEVYHWQVTHLGLRIRDGAAPHAFDAHDAAGRFLFAVHAATAGIEWLARFFGLLFSIHDSAPAAMRAKQEAPLVALVNAVPEGLDPIGWRAAVLAVHEHHGRYADRLRGDLFAGWLAFVLREGLTAGEVDGYHGLGYLEGLDSYQRAIAPAPKVDRQRLTWKTRGPVLPVDDWRDE